MNVSLFKSIHLIDPTPKSKYLIKSSMILSSLKTEIYCRSQNFNEVSLVSCKKLRPRMKILLSWGISFLRGTFMCEFAAVWMRFQLVLLIATMMTPLKHLRGKAIRLWILLWKNFFNIERTVLPLRYLALLLAAEFSSIVHRFTLFHISLLFMELNLHFSRFSAALTTFCYRRSHAGCNPKAKTWAGWIRFQWTLSHTMNSGNSVMSESETLLIDITPDDLGPGTQPLVREFPSRFPWSSTI